MKNLSQQHPPALVIIWNYANPTGGIWYVDWQVVTSSGFVIQPETLHAAGPVSLQWRWTFNIIAWDFIQTDVLI